MLHCKIIIIITFKNWWMIKVSMLKVWQGNQAYLKVDKGWCFGGWTRAILFFWHGFAGESRSLSEEGLCLSEEGLCLSEEGLCLTEEGLCLTEEGREIGEGYTYRVNRGRRVRRCKWFWRIAWSGASSKRRWACRVAAARYSNRCFLW